MHGDRERINAMPDKPSTPPNLDLIHQVQRARMLHDADAKPSEMQGVYWLEVKPDDPARQPTPRAGLLVIATNAADLDALWERVKATTRAGKLGYKAKASTASRGNAERVVLVCLADTDDVDEVARVHAELAALGLIAVLERD
jgi:hypothetical protein